MKAKGNVYVGCSGWAYASWKPEFYPAKLAAKKMLEYYATRLNTVEVNYTFRSLPTEKITAAWLAATGEDFRFSFKAPQRITHFARLKNCAALLHSFGESIRPVVESGRMGLVLFQLPPNFKADVPRLDAFLTDAAALGLQLAFEFRDDSWFAEDVYGVLRGHGAALCAAESDDLATPEVATADFHCYRLRKSTYSEKDLAAVAAKLRKNAGMGDVYAYFKHEEEPTGALRAAAVRQSISST